MLLPLTRELNDPTDYASEVREAMDMPARRPERSALELGPVRRPRRRLIGATAGLLLLAAIGVGTVVVLDRTGEEGGAVSPSSDAGPVTVPDVVGLAQDEATGRLEGAGLVVEPQAAGSPAGSPAASGTVASQAPAAGSNVVLGSTVTLDISSP